MPFEVFRRHQKKLLTVLGILAMFGFVISDSVPRMFNASYAGRDQEIATIYHETIYRSKLQEMHEERNLANAVVFEIIPYLGQKWFGDTSERDLVDALILEHEADRLGVPGGPDTGREFLELITNNMMNGERFDRLMSRLNVRVTDDQLLAALANQLRLKNVRGLMGRPLVTPYDVFRVYRDQNERVSAKLVAVPAEKFLAKVAEPTDDEIRALFEKYKDVLPDPDSETPGFKVPRQVQFEILSIASDALARSMRDKLTETELRTAYENHKNEYPMRSELPTDLFARQPELTPQSVRSFDDVRLILAIRVAEEKAQAEINNRFGAIKDEVMIPFANDYSTAVDELAEAKKRNPKATAVLPTSPSVKELAERDGMSYEITRLLSREEAEEYGPISSAEVGTSRLSSGRKFAEELFDPKKQLFEPEELIDDVGIRFLVRKIKDVPPHVPDLSEVRSDVSLALKMAKARALAEKSADELAADLKKKGATIKDDAVPGYRVVTTSPIPRRNPSVSEQDTPIPPESLIPDVPHAGDAFRNAYFGLQPGTVAVAPNRPRTVFYVMALDRREPATFDALYAPNSDEYRYKMSARDQAAVRLDEEWMAWLRKEAGLKPDWIPPDELRKKNSGDET
jgi:hypothetical protein